MLLGSTIVSLKLYEGSRIDFLTGTVGANQDQPGKLFKLFHFERHLIVVVLQQLNDGIRMLQMQAHNAGGVIKLCHSDCVSVMPSRLHRK